MTSLLIPVICSSSRTLPTTLLAHILSTIYFEFTQGLSNKHKRWSIYDIG